MKYTRDQINTLMVTKMKEDNFASRVLMLSMTLRSRKNFDDNYTVDKYLCNEKLTLYRYLAEAYLDGETTVVRPEY